MPPGDIPDPEVKQLDSSVIGGEMAAVLGYLPQLEVDRLDRYLELSRQPGL
jgi:hypothetical protein